MKSAIGIIGNVHYIFTSIYITATLLLYELSEYAKFTYKHCREIVFYYDTYQITVEMSISKGNSAHIVPPLILVIWNPIEAVIMGIYMHSDNFNNSILQIQCDIANTNIVSKQTKPKVFLFAYYTSLLRWSYFFSDVTYITTIKWLIIHEYLKLDGNLEVIFIVLVTQFGH